MAPLVLQLCHSILKSLPEPLEPLAPSIPLPPKPISHTLLALSTMFYAVRSTFDFFNYWGENTGLVLRTHSMEGQTRISCRISGDSPQELGRGSFHKEIRM